MVQPMVERAGPGSPCAVSPDGPRHTAYGTARHTGFTAPDARETRCMCHCITAVITLFPPFITRG